MKIYIVLLCILLNFPFQFVYFHKKIFTWLTTHISTILRRQLSTTECKVYLILHPFTCSINNLNLQHFFLCKKMEVKNNTTHCTNSNREAAILLSLVQLSMIVLFSTLKDEVLPSSNSISRKIIRLPLPPYIDSALSCYLIYLLLCVHSYHQSYYYKSTSY